MWIGIGALGGASALGPIDKRKVLEGRRKMDDSPTSRTIAAAIPAICKSAVQCAAQRFDEIGA